MSLFAGVFRLSTEENIPLSVKQSIEKNLSRNTKEEKKTFRYDDSDLFLVKWSSGSFEDNAWINRENRNISTLAGDPILTENGHRINRDKQLEVLHQACETENWNVFAKTRGSFSFVNFDSKKKLLHLTTDALGVRSIYYSISNGFLFFSSALRILEEIQYIKKTLSEAGMAEQSLYDFPLDNRTPYNEIFVLKESEIISATNSEITKKHYYDWSCREVFNGTEEEGAEKLIDEFQESIRLRLHSNESHVYAFLSGGMDSRVIVSLLLKQGCQVEALNFSPPGSQDLRFAQLFSEAAGEKCCFNYSLSNVIYPNFSLLAYHMKTNIESNKVLNIDRPSFIWSGDGGSVGLGHVYMDQKMLDIYESQGVEATAQYFLALHHKIMPLGILTDDAKNRLPDIVLNNTISEINKHSCDDLGRRLYLFLLQNDQRRHLFKHFESIDLHGLEFLTPFYDTEFIKTVTMMPSHWCILHRLYARFFELLPKYAQSTPWQVYPGHVPCPVQSTEKLHYQWDREYKKPSSFVKRLTLAQSLFTIAGKNELPEGIFSSAKIYLAALLHLLNVKNYGYLHDFLYNYHRFYKSCITNRL